MGFYMSKLYKVFGKQWERLEKNFEHKLQQELDPPTIVWKTPIEEACIINNLILFYYSLCNTIMLRGIWNYDFSLNAFNLTKITKSIRDIFTYIVATKDFDFAAYLKPNTFAMNLEFYKSF